MNESQTNDDCLTDEQIESILANESTARTDTERIDQHLESCAACQQRIEQLLDIETSIDGKPVAAPMQRHMTTLLHGVEHVAHNDESMPTRLGRYHLLEEIGSGGMGRVFKAFDPDLQRHCALKVMNFAIKGDPEVIERFRREALAAARLEHASIVKVFEFGEDAGTVFIAMEWINGLDLSKTTARRSQDLVRNACLILRDAADAIAHAHAAGIVHRDLKPSNLLLTADSLVKIVDFGLAKDISAESDLTATGAFVGTVSYSSPEQVAGSAAASEPAIDIYALGAILYDLICGRPPFRTNDVRLTFMLILHYDPVSPRKLNPAVDRDLETICLKCLAKDPSARYASAADLRDDLTRYLSGESIQARRPPVHVAAWRWAKRRPALTAAWILAACLLIAAAVGVPLWSAREVQLARLEAEQKLAEQREEAAQRIAEARKRVTDAWRTRSVQTQATAWLNERIYFVSSELQFNVPEQLIGLDTKILKRRYSQGRLLIVDSWIDGDHPMIAVESSPNGKLLATADASGRVTLWDRSTGKPIRRLTEIPLRDDHNATAHYVVSYYQQQTEDKPIAALPYPTDLCWLANGNAIVAPTIDGRVLRLSTQRTDVTELATFDDSFHCAALVGEDRVVVAGANGVVRLLNVADGEMLAELRVAGSEIQTLNALGDNHFLCADASGRLSLVEVADGEAMSLKTVANLELGDSIFCVAEAPPSEAPNQRQLYVGMAGNRIAVVSIDTKVATVREETEREIVLHDEQLSAVHDLAIDPQLQQLHALDDLGRMWVVSLTGGRTLYRTDRLMENNYLGLIRGRMQADELVIPFPYRKRGQLVLFPERPDRFGLAGTNAAIAVYQLPTDATQTERELNTSLGNAAALQFDSQHNHLLWALRRDGTILLVDVESDHVVDQRVAHPTGAAHGICLGADKTIMTSGADGHIRTWQVSGGQIKPIAESMIEPHAKPLLSIAYCPVRRRVAAVDEQATLLIWDAVSGERLHTVSLDENKVRPFTGKVAFNLDGTQLLAFGARQSAHGFRLDPFERLSDQPAINSLGGTGVSWSPTDANKVIVCDPLYAQALEYGTTLTTLNEDILSATVRGNCTASAASFDGHRLACLQRNGVVRFLDTEIMIPLSSMRVPISDCIDMAFNANSNRLAVINEAGTIALLEAARDRTAPEEIVAAKAADPPWARTRLLETTDHLVTASHAIRIDSRGHVHAVLSPQAPVIPGVTSRDFRTDAAVMYVHENALGSAEQSLVRERLVHRYSTGLSLDRNDQPVIALRQRVPSEVSHYEGDALLARPTADGEWEFERYVRGYNMGFFPVIDLNDQGDVRSVVHFSYEDYSLIRSTPGERDSEDWPRKKIGLWGDGESMSHVTPVGDRVIYRSERRRFFGEFGMHFLMQLEPDGTLTRLARLHQESHNAYIRSDGTAFTILRDMETPGSVRYGLYRLVEGDWQQCLRFDGRLVGYLKNAFVVSANDTFHVAVVDATTNDLVLLSGPVPAEGMPPEKIVPVSTRIEGSKGQVAKHVLMLDPEDQPVIALFGSEGEQNYFDVLRPASIGN